MSETILGGDKHILGLDPGFAKFGVVVTKITETGMDLLEFKVITTKKGANRLVSQDLLIRGQEVARQLMTIIEPYNIKLICAEAMSFPRHATAASKMTLTWGIICLLSEQLRIPVVMQSPQKIKKALTGQSNASKEAVQDKLRELGYTLPEMNKSDYEHPSDALASIIACENTQIYRAVIGNET